MISVGLVAPEIWPPSVSNVMPLYHWYVNPAPVALTVKEADVPVQKVCDATGCNVIATCSVTLNEAVFEVTAGAQAPVTTQ